MGARVSAMRCKVDTFYVKRFKVKRSYKVIHLLEQINRYVDV